MRDSNPKRETQIAELPVYDRHVLLLVFKLLSATDPERENISFYDKQLFEDVLHYGTFSRVAELKKISPEEVSECYTRVVKALERTVKEAHDAPVLREEIESLEDRIQKNEKRLEKQRQELCVLRSEDSKTRKRGDETPSALNPDYMNIRLTDLDLPKRFYTRFIRQKLFTLGDILSLTPERFTRLIGESSLARDIKVRLEEMGWHVELDSQNHLEIKTLEAFEKEKLEEKIKELEDEVVKLEERLAEYEQDSRIKDATIEKLRKDLKAAVDLQIKQSQKPAPESIKIAKELAKAKKNEKEPKKRIRSLEKELHHVKAVYEYKQQSMNIWKNSLEAELAESRKLINVQQATIDKLQKENEKLKAQVAESENEK